MPIGELRDILDAVSILEGNVEEHIPNNFIPDLR